jgi:hypothetical protein
MQFVEEDAFTVPENVIKDLLYLWVAYLGDSCRKYRESVS